jgi:hypothetical protein
VAPPENSVTNSHADCALTQQMIGGTKAISPCVKSASAKLFLDLHTVSAPSGEERRTSASAQVERTGRCCRRFDSGTHAWCGHALTHGLGLISRRAARERLHRAPRYFRPSRPLAVWACGRVGWPAGRGGRPILYTVTYTSTAISYIMTRELKRDCALSIDHARSLSHVAGQGHGRHG